MTASRGAPRAVAQLNRKPTRPQLNTNWMDNAVPCTTSGIDFGSDSPREQHRARAICFGCPVRTQCLNHALTHRETLGVWGGLLPEERAGL